MRYKCLFSIFAVFVSACSHNNIKHDVIIDVDLMDIGRVPESFMSMSEIEKMPPTAIKVHIYIESYSILLESQFNYIDYISYVARSSSQIESDMSTAEEQFARIGLKLEIQTIEYIEPMPHVIINVSDIEPYRQRTDKEDKEDTLEVYYLFSHGGISVFSGCADLPWDGRGSIFIMGRLANKYTFAHELGHHLGLCHTFHKINYMTIDDGVEDTEDVVLPLHDGSFDFSNYTGDPVFDPNFNNLMSYATTDTRILTDGQLRRAYYYLTHDRKLETASPSHEYNIKTTLYNMLQEKQKSLYEDLLKNNVRNFNQKEEN